MTREEVGKLAFGLPAVTHVVQWGDHDVYKVGGKVFGICGGESLSFKVSEIGFLVLTETGVGQQAPYLAKGQWVIVQLDDVQADDVQGWLATSHSLIAAKLTKKARLELGLT